MTHVSEGTDHEVITDGLVVWVNDRRGCVARFSKAGVDVHRPGSDIECLWCTHERPSLVEWVRFVLVVQEQHGHDISHISAPTWLFEHAKPTST